MNIVCLNNPQYDYNYSLYCTSIPRTNIVLYKGTSFPVNSYPIQITDSDSVI